MSLIKAKRSLGQNFLTDSSVLTDIIKAVDPEKGKTIVEIGPGHGELTQLIAEGQPTNLILIEKDRRLIEGLREKFQKPNNKSQIKTLVQIIEGDALEIIRNSKLEIRNSTNYKLVGNIPYYITGQLFRIISELRHKPTSIVFMIQKEVAERICASASNGMNILAASIQIWAKPEIIRFVDRKAFNPAPKVDSAVIRLTTNKKQLTINEAQKYYKLIKILFKQPRKTIWNNIKQITPPTLRKAGVRGSDQNVGADNKHLTEEMLKTKLKKIGINLKWRPQNLSVEKLTQLSRVF